MSSHCSASARCASFIIQAKTGKAKRYIMSGRATPLLGAIEMPNAIQLINTPLSQKPKTKKKWFLPNQLPLPPRNEISSIGGMGNAVMSPVASYEWRYKIILRLAPLRQSDYISIESDTKYASRFSNQTLRHSPSISCRNSSTSITIKAAHKYQSKRRRRRSGLK